MRWGLVGAGPWAHSVHAPSLATHPSASFEAVWSRDASKAEQLAEKHHVRVAQSFDELLSTVDALSFAVAPAAQPEFASAALERGIHVLLEKPVATDPQLVERLSAQRESGTRAAVFLTRIFEPTRLAWVRDAVGAGYTTADVEWISSALTPGSMYANSKWRMGAGMVWDVLPHILSQVEPVLGAVSAGRVERWPHYGGLVIELTHAQGAATTSITMTLDAPQQERRESIRFDGSGRATQSPDGALDYVAAHSAALDALETGRALDEDPVQRLATLEAAAEPVGLMAELAAEATELMKAS